MRMSFPNIRKDVGDLGYNVDHLEPKDLLDPRVMNKFFEVQQILDISSISNPHQKYQPQQRRRISTSHSNVRRRKAFKWANPIHNHQLKYQPRIKNTFKVTRRGQRRLKNENKKGLPNLLFDTQVQRW